MLTTENATPVTFSLYKDEDYEGFLACIEDFYRGGYPYKEYLDRQNLRRLLASGDIIITLAKDIGGRVVGTSSALRMSGRFFGSVLLLLRCVLEEMRGSGIGTEQERYLLEQIRIHFPDAISLYADVMTHDAASQTTMIRRGFVFCGLRMMLYKNEIIVPTLKYAEGTKMTQAIYCKPAHPGEKRTLFAPASLHGVLRDIYSSLSAAVEFASDNNVCGEGLYKIEKSELHEKAELFVDRHGEAERFVREMNALLSSGYTAVAYINMSIGGCSQTYNALKAIGFYFSGVKPLSADGEYLVLSNSKNAVLVLDDIKSPEEAAPLFQTVIKEIRK